MKKYPLFAFLFFFIFGSSTALATSLGSFENDTTGEDKYDQNSGKTNWDGAGAPNSYEQITAQEYDGIVEFLKKFANNCDQGQILKWSRSTGKWECGTDETGPGGGTDGVVTDGEVTINGEDKTLSLTRSLGAPVEIDVSNLGGGGDSLWTENTNNTAIYRENGNVGIGTNEPYTKLFVAGSNSELLRVEHDSDEGYIQVKKKGNVNNITMGFNNNNAYIWSTVGWPLKLGTVVSGDLNNQGHIVLKSDGQINLPQMSCGTGQVLALNTDKNITCVDDQIGTGTIPNCADNQILVFDTKDTETTEDDKWTCQPKPTANRETCDTAGEILVWNAGDEDWECEMPSIPGPTTCDDGQILMWSDADSDWKCVFVEEAIEGCDENYGQVLMWLADVDGNTETTDPGWGCGDIDPIDPGDTECADDEIKIWDKEANTWICLSTGGDGYWDGFNSDGDLSDPNDYAYILNNGSTLKPVGIGGNFTGPSGTDPVGALLHVKNDNATGTMAPGLAIIGGALSGTESQVGDENNNNGGINNIIIGHGTVINSNNNDYNYQIAIGNLNKNEGNRSMSFGNNITTGGDYQIGIGREVNTGTGENNFAFGNNIEMNDAQNSFAFGHTLRTSDASSQGGNKSMALGSNAQVSGLGAVAIGAGGEADSELSADYSTAAFGDHSIAIGRSAETYGENAIAIGRGASAGESTGTGAGEQLTGNNSLAIGNDVKVSVDNAFAIGRNSAENDTENSILISNSGNKDIFIDTNGNTGFGTDTPSYKDGRSGIGGGGMNDTAIRVNVNGKLRVHNLPTGGDTFLCTDNYGVVHASTTPCDQGGLYVCHLKKQTCYTPCTGTGCPNTVTAPSIITVSGKNGTTCVDESKTPLTSSYISDTQFCKADQFFEILDEFGNLTGTEPCEDYYTGLNYDCTSMN